MKKNTRNEAPTLPKFIKVRHKVITDEVVSTFKRSLSSGVECDHMKDRKMTVTSVNNSELNEEKKDIFDHIHNHHCYHVHDNSCYQGDEEICDMVEGTYTCNEIQGWKLDLISKFKPRDNDRIRNDLLSKLTYKKIWLTPCEKPTSHKTLIIFDWDDTLLCTSYLNPFSGGGSDKIFSSKAINHLKKIEGSVQKLLNAASKLGQTYIITNAEGGWVECSAQMYMPKVYEAFDKVKIISAREKYERLFPGNPIEWKVQAFQLTGEDLEESTITNLVVMGDSKIEMDAGAALASKFSTACIKTIKFKECPTPNELNNQLLVSKI